VVITDESIGVSQLLAIRARAAPQSTPMNRRYNNRTLITLQIIEIYDKAKRNVIYMYFKTKIPSVVCISRCYLNRRLELAPMLKRP